MCVCVFRGLKEHFIIRELVYVCVCVYLEVLKSILSSGNWYNVCVCVFRGLKEHFIIRELVCVCVYLEILKSNYIIRELCVCVCVFRGIKEHFIIRELVCVCVCI